MLIRVMVNETNKTISAENKQELELRDLFNRANTTIEHGYIEIDTENNEPYLQLLLHSDLIKLFNRVYKIRDKHILAINPYVLWIFLC